MYGQVPDSNLVHVSDKINFQSLSLSQAAVSGYRQSFVLAILVEIMFNLAKNHA